MVVGQEIVVERILVSLFTGGHLLLQGVPGLAKTLLVSVLSKSIDLESSRIQFTIDLLPSDILGSEILDQRSNEFRTHKGPIFTNLLLADEINRAAPKVQSALLEAMQERTVTIGNQIRPVKSGELIRIKSSDAWLDLLPDLKPRLAMLYAQLFLKVNEENAAFPYIEELAKGCEIDKIQPLRLDFDFLDTSGYVVIPVESPAVPIDVKEEGAPSRPIENLEITQILDERQADEGKLILEIKVTGQGLVPALEEILDLRPKDFEIVDTEDQGLAVSKFAEETAKNRIVSERSWLVTLKAKAHLAERPGSFAFATPKMENAKSLRQRYSDADLVPAEELVSLERKYGEHSRADYWIVGIGILAAVVLTVCVWMIIKSASRGKRPDESLMPKEITPFSVLALLRNLQRSEDLSDARQEELSTTIDRIERYYFVEGNGGNGKDAAAQDAASNGRNGEPDLDLVARTWIAALPPRARTFSRE